MASVFVLLEAFNRKEAAALGFFPCATASLFLFCVRIVSVTYHLLHPCIALLIAVHFSVDLQWYA